MLYSATFLYFLFVLGSRAMSANGDAISPNNQYNQNPYCLPGYVYINGLCYNYGNIPQGGSTCPNGYALRDNWCYPACSTCPNSPTSITTTVPILPTSTTTTTTLRPIISTSKPIPPPDTIEECPKGSIFIEGKCRKKICPLGEIVNGQCLQITCPDGTVWHDHNCQEPRFITTIIEIENVIQTEVNEKQGQVIRENVTNIEYVTEAPKKSIDHETTTKPIIIRPPDPIIEPGCCTVISPRICKRYGKKWVCFHRRVKRCGPICKSPTIYLKTPEIINSPPHLYMPPNPPLQACPTPYCENSDVVDCSGCAQNRRESCSPYCYSYICPNGACNYLNLQDYCQSYPGEFGCRKDDGCTWNWCGEK